MSFVAFAQSIFHPAVYAVAAGLLVLLGRHVMKRRRTAMFPRIGIDPGFLGLRMQAAKNEFLRDGFKLVAEGYSKYKDVPFVVQTSDMERLIIPNKFLKELNYLPESKLSHQDTIVDRHLGWYTGMDCIRGTHAHIDACKVQLKNHLGVLMEGMNEELEFALRIHLDGCTTTTPKTILTYRTILDMVVRITSRVYVQKPLCRNEEWLKAATSYTGDVAALSGTLRKQVAFVRPLIYPFLSRTKILNQDIATARKLLVPIILSRRNNPSAKKEADMIQWLSDSARNEFREPDRIARMVLFLVMAAAHTSTMTIVHALYDLCSMPEVMKDLREEAIGVLADEPADTWSMNAILRLRKLDSFLRESQRCNPSGALGFHRKTRSEITLSSGAVIPKGIMIGMTGGPMLAKDPNRYSSPETFDYLRFYDDSATTDSGIVEQFTTLTEDSFRFGSGRSSCPGRWYASAQIKLIVATLLTQYDFKFPDGQITRPPNTHSDEKASADRTQKLEFQRRG